MAIAGAMERKVWVRTAKGALYPNLYVFIIAPPGIGKTEVIWRVRDMWQSLEEHHVGNSSLTKASLIDSLNEAERKLVFPEQSPPVISFNSLLVASNELGVLLPSYDTEFMNALTDLYDGKGYSESRRTNKLKISIEQPNLSIIAGCTPGYLKETLPPGAWDQGFLSRVILIYSGAHELQSLWSEQTMDAGMDEALKARLAEIGELYGELRFTQAAKEFIDRWYLGGQEPKPEHPRLINYNIRRTAHLLKLCAVACVNTNAFPTIDLPHVQQALDWLVEAEFAMPDIFKSMTSGGDGQVIEDTWHFIYEQWIRGNKQPLGEHRLIYFLQERIPAQHIVRIIETMERSKMLQRTHVKGVGVAFVPGQKQKI